MKGCFSALQAALTREIELFLAKLSGAWVIETEASNFVVGGVLKQEQAPGNWRPVACFSRKLERTRQKGNNLDQRGGHQGKKRPMPLCVAS